MANKIAPLHPTHPGEIIKDEIIFRGISQRQLSIEIGISYTQLNELLNGKHHQYTNRLAYSQGVGY